MNRCNHVYASFHRDVLIVTEQNIGCQNFILKKTIPDICHKDFKTKMFDKFERV